MQTLIIILIVVMIINDILDIGVYYKNHLYKQQNLLLQETVKNTQVNFINQKQRYEKIIDEYKELVKNLTYKCDTQAIRIKGLEEERTIIISGDIKGTDMDGGVKGEMGSNAVVDDEDEQVYMKEFIEKACTWLRNFYDAETGIYFVERDIKDFRKYMEEQQ